MGRKISKTMKSYSGCPDFFVNSRFLVHVDLLSAIYSILKTFKKNHMETGWIWN